MISTEKIIEIADKHTTPMYIFDIDVLRSRINNMKEILGEGVNICYAMKANPFLLDALKETAASFEVCSPGEFAICERENVPMDMIILSGVNKEKADIEHVFKEFKGAGVYTAESLRQLELLNECAVDNNLVVDVLLRITSGNQFGMDEELIEKIIADRDSYKGISVKGLQCYSGTQKKKVSVPINEVKWMDEICDKLYDKYGFKAERLEYGPGLPFNYFGEDAYNNSYDMLKEFAEELDQYKAKYEITLEMGRFIASECGVFVSEVADIKNNGGQNYCIIDGGINHINYYGQTMAMKIPAYTYVAADGRIIEGYDAIKDDGLEKWTICGSLCTVGDVIVKNLPIGKPAIGDKIIFRNIGAYSVTEGIYLFLSRRMPVIAAYTEADGVTIYRDMKPSDVINSRSQVL